MIMKINYCIVNWAFEDEELLEPYEWQEDDSIEFLFNIDIFRVSKQVLIDCKEAILTFNNLERGYYLLCDGKSYIVIAVNKDSQLWMRSHVEYQLKERLDPLVAFLPLKQLDYELHDYQQTKEYGLTRFEKEKKQLLLSCLDLFDHEELCFLSCNNWDYIENGYHLFHEYFYHQLCKNRYKKSDPLG